MRNTTSYDHNYHQDEGYQNAEEPNYEAKNFNDMLETAKNPL